MRGTTRSAGSISVNRDLEHIFLHLSNDSVDPRVLCCFDVPKAAKSSVLDASYNNLCFFLKKIQNNVYPNKETVNMKAQLYSTSVQASETYDLNIDFNCILRHSDYFELTFLFLIQSKISFQSLSHVTVRQIHPNKQ